MFRKSETGLKVENVSHFGTATFMANLLAKQGPVILLVFICFDGLVFGLQEYSINRNMNEYKNKFRNADIINTYSNTYKQRQKKSEKKK